MRNSLLLVLMFFLALPSFSQNHAPVAVDDYAVTTRGYVKINLLANDFDPDGDSIWIKMCHSPRHGGIRKIGANCIEYSAFNRYEGGYDTLSYIIKDGHLFDTAKVFITVDNSLQLGQISVNNAKAAVAADGFLFADRDIIPSQMSNEITPMNRIPKETYKRTIFSGNLWLGGKDFRDSLHIAAQMFCDNGNDFWAGPVSSVYDSLYDYKYKRVWKITKADIDHHLAHCWSPSYVPSQALLDWPGNGDVAAGQAATLAPFYDANMDGFYDPYTGDYPLIKGDEAVLFMFNDDRQYHMQSQGKKLSVDIIGMLYAFDCPVDSALWNTYFLNFKIINRSPRTYYDTYIGAFVLFDLGSYWDNYFGTDVQRSSFYAYNGSNTDGNGGLDEYGANPPAQSVTFLGGPYLERDGLDNPVGNCDEGINGLNFGNSIVDDERLGLSKSAMFCCGGGPDYNESPEHPNDYYNYLSGRWLDSIPMHYWGGAHPAYGGTGPVCSYMFPGNSDPCNWGTHGIDPGGTEPWTERQAGNDPYGRRGYGSSGPFTFLPGATQELDLAFVFGRDFTDTNALAAIPVMQQRIDAVKSYFINDMTPCGSRFSAYDPGLTTPVFLYVYPNPAQDAVTLEFTPGSYSGYTVFDIIGNQVLSGSLNDSRAHTLNISMLNTGMYLIRLEGGAAPAIRKIIKTGK